MDALYHDSSYIGIRYGRARTAFRAVLYRRSGRARDTTRGGRERGDALEVDVTTAHRTDHLPTLFELSARDDKCVVVRTRLSQQRAGLRPLIGDGRAFGIVLVIRGDQLGTIDDGGDDGLERCNLTRCPLLFGLDDLQEALDVERAHSDELDLAAPCAATDPAGGIRARRLRSLYSNPMVTALLPGVTRPVPPVAAQPKWGTGSERPARWTALRRCPSSTDESAAPAES